MLEQKLEMTFDEIRIVSGINDQPTVELCRGGKPMLSYPVPVLGKDQVFSIGPIRGAVDCTLTAT